ncbi:hypothetical protein GCK72_012289 [Caenorhabditis remanei]|uniref:Uncharacterized protein n=1 Tax=Caenorhabditis remanei TaxID=31234 RepID=A0A6A5GKK2_CAERE|nr:hypothetical protein GCK72_012289 [Caenorhabditis remanei]KAF1755838.1 hypothetical protein GCK72_012289 [Caenorhabditis remanei]
MAAVTERIGGVQTRSNDNFAIFVDFFAITYRNHFGTTENQNLKAYIWNLYNENVMMKHQLTQRYAAVDPNTAMPNF